MNPGARLHRQEPDGSCYLLKSELIRDFKDFLTVDLRLGKVTVDGHVRGTTDADGKIYLGYLGGGEHTVRATCSGYTDTNVHLLGNDIFVVTSS